MRRVGKTQWVRIESLAGEPCRLRTSLAVPVTLWHNGRQSAVAPNANGTIAIALAKGRSAVAFTGAQPPALAVAPVAAQPGRINYNGLRKIEAV